jgi:hypothetical protein
MNTSRGCTSSMSLHKGTRILAALTLGLTLTLGGTSHQARAEDEPMVVEMSKELEDALGPSAVSAVSTDENNTQTLHLRSDFYQQVQEVDRSAPVSFPIDVSQIVNVVWVGGSDNRVLIIYEASPAKVLDCRMIGGTYTCYSS